MPPLCRGGLVKNSLDTIWNKGLNPFILVFYVVENTSEKMEFLLIDTCQQLIKVEPLPVRVGTMDIQTMNCVRNLGAWFDLMSSKGNSY